jgi:nucleotide-binding universal stress UspA family protein
VSNNTRIVVAYDGSLHADDALVLARRLANVTGGSLELAHVYHTHPVQHGAESSHAGREVFLRRRAEQLLASGAERAGDPTLRRHVVAATTTATGLRELAAREGVDILVFGSASDATPGRVHPGSAARRLLQNGPSALAFAPVGYGAGAEARLSTLAAIEDDAAGSARRTATVLAELAAGRVVEGEQADLLVLGSRPGAPERTLQVSPAAERAIQRAASPVLVMPRTSALDLEASRAAV